ncbi:bifunctional 2-C-methyl-D-erythritol 4-phosphate cytidylyltransferase/2-C-methyl-D-erythritol 2,4-cyclodiphosphate synthase [Erythrobacter litoralis]|uniref:Bifunctional enzyme IspD/IspF n=1 Tax=Erythrobacter litoralis (strain HTCC2594) TaxID=314225 RepID=ISPDF_ERYLH|nr:bifunctional 2-C-methyl-D-erythritol 4-phosphate cytidylyltransferase/2-C-methyl-D-erythritol 2,4-cyclodiphosphate synthase [Erythrobacter litoralis]Q2NAE1.1 RecName: Full=Bifunctional enzyme IspD/IspF; Includes: RecName: Full=2-C-methyl-D-erythritol 4-phosphate cytidylyltransferase; AltName: Full=4-diphosphocytidyl-2C-methyl-D-erythritol synthase; AltName: Full=MEP cytidylyltransferase; Short=MCT; Includes: RecName: Full=2-C-methyl-D-erythritol 2,4-cyclodiphosphate synthase; Short=MECDP-syntha
MATPSPLPSFAAIVVAAGKGLRAGQPVPKQFATWRGKPVLRHSVESLRAAGADPIVVAIPDHAGDVAAKALDGITEVVFVTGGQTRQDSVRAALERLSSVPPERVLIHDAARAILPTPVIERVLHGLDESGGAIPVLPVVDSLAVAAGERMADKADRESLRRVQTPQGFRFSDILAAHRAWTGATDAGDDAQVLMAHGGDIALVEGDEALKKLTFAEDFMADLLPVRVGTGFDVHKLEAGEELWLGGIRLEHDKGLAGHSDADVALHAIVDALLGAIGKGDIGDHFPPSDPQWKGAASSAFIEHAAKLVDEAGYRVGNIDLTIICEAPRIGPHRDAMGQRIAELLATSPDAISVKATTTEKLGFTGRGEGIAAQAAATVVRKDTPA